MLPVENSSLNDEHSQDYFTQQVQKLINQKDFKKAEELIRQRVQAHPGSADPYYWLGILHYAQGNLPETIDELRRAISLDSHHTDSAICLSILLNDIGKYDDAKKIFEQANQSVTHKNTGADLEIDKKFSVKHLELADLYFRYRRYDDAIEEYSKAAILDPSTLEIRIRRAKAYAKKGFLTRSMQDLQQIKHEAPHYLPSRIQLGLLHYSQGNILDAELEWESVTEIEPTHREAIAYLEMAKQARIKSKKTD